MRANPYTPGAGVMPAYLAGRDKQIEYAEECLRNLQNRYPQRSVVYYGLRGVGKTVLLNRIEEAADNLGIIYTHIEASENGKDQRNFTVRLLSAIQKFTIRVSGVAAAKEMGTKISRLLKSVTVKYNAEDSSFGIGLAELPDISLSYEADLTEVMVDLGKAAKKADETICFFVDEIQYLSKEELGGLIESIHRCNQLRLPLMVFCAGLPKILKAVGEAYSYTERLFEFEEIDALNKDDAEAAVVLPARDSGVDYSDEALSYIVETTGCYPYFIQQFCNTIWKNADSELIDLDQVRSAEREFWATLDKSFFSVRYERCTELDRAFIAAMVKCGELPCVISDVAKNMGRTVTSISTARAQLISKGMIYPTAHGAIDFTVPKFADFIRRINPNLESD